MDIQTRLFRRRVLFIEPKHVVPIKIHAFIENGFCLVVILIVMKIIVSSNGKIFLDIKLKL